MRLIMQMTGHDGQFVVTNQHVINGAKLDDIKIGLNAGEPVEKSNDLFGATVNLTDAIASQTDPDLILVSQVIRDLCRGKKLPFTEHGDVELSGFDEPIRLFEVDWRKGA